MIALARLSMRWLALVGVLVVAMSGSATAQAVEDVPSETLPTTSPVHWPMIESLEPVARAYWAQRGVTLPGPVEVFEIPSSEYAGLGSEPGNRIWLGEGLLAGRGLAGRSYLCMTYLHERGHNAGLAHGSGDPIMAADPWKGMKRVVPKCFAWAEAGFKRFARSR